MTQAELDEVLVKHKKWLNNEDGGERAYLRDADLLKLYAPLFFVSYPLRF